MRARVAILISVGVLSAYLLFLHRLGDRDLWNSHEARAAMNAQTMLDEGEWLVPRLFDGQWELQKPPLYYWMVAGSAALLGGRVDAWSARLPSALAGVGAVLVLAWLGWSCRRGRGGFLAGLVLATAVHFTWLARAARIDMPLTLTVLLAVSGFYLALEHGRRRYLLLGYVALAAGMLLKGPIGIVLPGAVLGLWLLLERRLSLIRHLGLWWGIPLVVLLTLPWFWLANLATGGELFRVFFWLHNVQRGLGGSRLRGHPWWFYGPRFLADFLPWSIPLLILAWKSWREGWLREDRLMRFGLVWFAAVTLLLSVVRYKRADYLVPAYPGAALFLGCAFCRLWETSRWLKPCLAVVVPLCLLGWVIRVDVLLPRVEPRREHHTFARAIRDRDVRPLFFRTEAHPLAFHLGRPIRILIWWEDLERELRQGREYVLMPEEVARQWPEHLSGITLEPIVSNSELIEGRHEKPHVLLRARLHSGSSLASVP